MSRCMLVFTCSLGCDTWLLRKLGSLFDKFCLIGLTLLIGLLGIGLRLLGLPVCLCYAEFFPHKFGVLALLVCRVSD